MEKFYSIHDNNAEIVLSQKVYPLVSVKKAIINFIEKIYTKIDISDDKIIIYISLKQNTNNLEEIIGEFYNELLRESLRYNIAVETKNLRELIVGRALYTTCIELDEEQEKTQNEIDELTEENNIDYDDEQDYSIDEIATNWFEKYENDEEKKC